jgi:glutamyl-tRNA reductase
MLGTNHERAAIDTRARLAFSGDDLSDGLRQLSTIAHEGVILSTCNRTELYALMDNDDDRDGGRDLRQLLAGTRDVPERVIDDITYLHTGADAARHLYRVACGLDSMMLGEPQILGQIQGALTDARAAQATGPILTRLYTEALRAGKLARTTTGIARNRLSISHAAVDLAQREMEGLAGCRAVVIGAGEIGTLTAKVLRTAKLGEIVIANRSPERGQELAATVEGRYVPLSALQEEMTDADVVFCAVSAPGYLLDQDILPHLAAWRTTPLLAIDLCVPRGIAPEVGQHPLVRLFSVDDLESIATESRTHYAEEIGKAEAIIERGVQEFLDWWRIRNAAPTIRAMQERAEAIRQREVERALRKLAHLSERDREVVEALSVALVGKFLHAPVTAVREAAQAGTHEEIIRAVEALFGVTLPDIPPLSDEGSDGPRQTI